MFFISGTGFAVKDYLKVPFWGVIRINSNSNVRYISRICTGPYPLMSKSLRHYDMIVTPAYHVTDDSKGVEKGS